MYVYYTYMNIEYVLTVFKYLYIIFNHIFLSCEFKNYYYNSFRYKYMCKYQINGIQNKM